MDLCFPAKVSVHNLCAADLWLERRGLRALKLAGQGSADALHARGGPLRGRPPPLLSFTLFLPFNGLFRGTFYPIPIETESIVLREPFY